MSDSEGYTLEGATRHDFIFDTDRAGDQRRFALLVKGEDVVLCEVAVGGKYNGEGFILASDLEGMQKLGRWIANTTKKGMPL